MARRLTSTLPAVNGGLEFVILTEKSEIFQYEDGKRISATPIGMRLVTSLPGARLASLAIRFEKDPIPNITDEQIRASVESCQFLYATIPGCEVMLYPSANGIGMTATGKSAQLVNLEK